VFVPIILWTAQVFASRIPLPAFIPRYTYVFNEHLLFEVNFPALLTGAYLAYYYALEPVAAVRPSLLNMDQLRQNTDLFMQPQFLYTPQLMLSLLTATALSHDSRSVEYAILLHITAWVAQFLGHGVAEKRAPALLDNLIGGLSFAFCAVPLMTNRSHVRQQPSLSRRSSSTWKSCSCSGTGPSCTSK
jgi:2-hydroxy fatty acid dioxygenase